MTYRILTKKLHKLGCELIRQAPGSHEIWLNPKNKLFTTIPNLGSKDIPKGTVAAIPRDPGFTRKDLDEA